MSKTGVQGDQSVTPKYPRGTVAPNVLVAQLWDSLEPALWLIADKRNQIGRENSTRDSAEEIVAILTGEVKPSPSEWTEVLAHALICAENESSSPSEERARRWRASW